MKRAMVQKDNLEIQRKRLLWRATHRGVKEMDILFGGFALRHLPNMAADDLVEFAALLELPDQDVLHWVTHKDAVPASLQSPLLSAILAYRPEPVA
jgi:antitoxin CptB